MNKFSDGFSDNSYEDLLNEYAGESLGSKNTGRAKSQTSAEASNGDIPVKRVPTKEPVKRAPIPPAPVKKTPTVNNTKPRAVQRDLDVDTASVKRKQALDLNMIKSFEEEQAERNSRANKLSGTVEFNKNAVVSAIKSAPVIEKRNANGKPDTTRSKKLQRIIKSAPNGQGKLPPKANGGPEEGGKSSKKFSGKNIKNAVILAFKENKRSFIVFGCCFLIAGILASIALSCINDVLAIGRDSETVVEVVLPNDADTDIAIDVLDDAGLIKNKLFCKLFIKAMGYTDKNYLPGVYYLSESMGVEKMISRFKTSSTRGAVISITIPEGYTIDQIFERLEKNGVCTSAALYKTIDEVDFSSEYDFIKDISDTQNRYHVLEGYMFPATYEFQQGADPAAVIRTFLNEFNKRWTEDFAARAAELSMTTDDIIRIASIIEKEAYGDEQFTLVSSVLHNRLNRSGLYPTLECNSTTEYVTKTITARLSKTRADAYLPYYNTYECSGLPASAICNPGIDAIKAALYPDTTQYYFFRHDKNGKIYMAKTVEEHSANGRIVANVNASE
ncbi:MAG: endolytic transglycosylase MltG [Candidatus Fimenecus sp.]